MANGTSAAVTEAARHNEIGFPEFTAKKTRDTSQFSNNDKKGDRLVFNLREGNGAERNIKKQPVPHGEDGGTLRV
jgi:hypothetical protein